MANSINAQVASLGVKNLAYVNKNSGKVAIDKGNAQRAAILAKAASRNKK